MLAALSGALLVLAGVAVASHILREARDPASARIFYGGGGLVFAALIVVYLGAMRQVTLAVVLGAVLLGVGGALMGPGYRAERRRR